MHIVTIDIGNTESVFGLWEEDTLQSIYRTSTQKDKSSDDWYYLLEPWLKRYFSLNTKTQCILSSVVPSIENALKHGILKIPNTSVSKIHHKMPFPFKINYPQFHTLGLDRVANLTASSVFYSQDAIIIDLGTAITICYLSNNIYEGGCIFPGIQTSTLSLVNKAEKLTNIELKKSHSVIGKNTQESLEAGIYFGFKGMLNYIIKEMLKYHATPSKVKIIGTGGIIHELPYADEIFDIVDQNLTLKGLNYLARL